MKKVKALVLGVAAAGVLLAVMLTVSPQPAYAKVANWLFGEALRVATPYSATSGTPDVTLVAGGAYIQGALEVDGAARFDGAVTAAAIAQTGASTNTSGSVSVSSGTSAGATAFRNRGAYTSTQLATLSASPGDYAFNLTITQPVYSSATIASGALTGAWIMSSTSTAYTKFAGY